MLAAELMSFDPDAELEVTSTVDLVWVDEVAGNFVWAVNPWEINAIDKDGAGTFVVGEDGTTIDKGDVGDVDDSDARRSRGRAGGPARAGRQRCR